MFSTLYGTYFSFQMHFKMSSVICFNLDQFETLSSGNGLTHYHTMPHFDALKIFSCGNIVRKGEIACNKQFLPFSQCFYPIWHLLSVLNVL